MNNDNNPVVSHAELAAVLNSAPFVHEYGFALESSTLGVCTIRCPFNKKFLRPDGIVSGPVLMAAADAAMWMAVISALGKEAVATVTTEMKTNFVSAAKGGEDILCTAKVVKAGRRLIFGTAECTTMDGKLLAFHTLSYVRRDG